MWTMNIPVVCGRILTEVVFCRKHAFLTAAAEMWLLSLTDYQVPDHQVL
jgi:hypothetical protein